MKQSALKAVWEENGATGIVEVDGIELAASFGDPHSEYLALTRTAGIVDLSFRKRLRLAGADQVDFLHAMLSQDIKSLGVGEGCEALLLTVQGKVVADIGVWRFKDEVILEAMASRVPVLAQVLGGYIVADDVTLGLVGEGDGAVGVFGPRRKQVLEGALVTEPVSCQPYKSWEAEVEAGPVRIFSLPSPGCGGFMLVADRELVSDLWRHLVKVGRDLGAGAAGFEAYDSLRVESGQPWDGMDVGEETIALEACLERAISFDKGCYPGQEVIERVSSRGSVNRRLVGLVLDCGKKPEAGTRLLEGDTEVGWITSVAYSHKLDSLLALGYVRREHWAAGSELTLQSAPPGKARVTKLPL